MATNSESSKLKYHFNLVGTVKELIYPNKAILQFKLNEKEEKAILLSKVLSLNGKPIDDMITSKQTMADYVKLNDTVSFDCHVYDKGGFTGASRCNFYATKAWNLNNCENSSSNSTTVSNLMIKSRPSLSGWVSEIFDRSGVITFCDSNTGLDDRVYFSADKLYLYEKRFGGKYSLSGLLTIGDPINFDAVRMDENEDRSLYHDCYRYASIVWKGKRPSFTVDLALIDRPWLSSSMAFRRDSLDSSSESDLNADDSCSNSFKDSFILLPTTGQNSGLDHGKGNIAKIFGKSGILWWKRKVNHFESVWFTADKTFKNGLNLHDQNLGECLKEGDSVTIVVEPNRPEYATKWSAIQVIIS